MSKKDLTWEEINLIRETTQAAINFLDNPANQFRSDANPDQLSKRLKEVIKILEK